MINNLKKSELKKIERYAKERDGERAVVSAWWTEKQSDVDELTGFQTIGCEMMKADYSDRVENVYIAVCIWDRRRSFVKKNAEQYK